MYIYLAYKLEMGSQGDPKISLIVTSPQKSLTWIRRSLKLLNEFQRVPTLDFEGRAFFLSYRLQAERSDCGASHKPLNLSFQASPCLKAYPSNFEICNTSFTLPFIDNSEVATTEYKEFN